MKHKLTIFCSVAVVVVLAYVAVQSYDRHQVKVRTDRTYQSLAAQQYKKEADLKQAHLQENLQKLTLQCQNFTVAYGQLTAVQKSHIPAPDCVLTP